MACKNLILLAAASAVLLSVLAGCKVTVTVPAVKATPQPVDTAALEDPPVSLEELVLLYRDEYAMLTEEDREAVTQIWSSNPFNVMDAEDMLDVYGAYLSKDAAAVLFVWNARCCAEYIKENFDGDPHYISFVDVSLYGLTMDFIALWSEGLPRESFEIALTEELTAFRDGIITAIISDEDYTSPVNDLMLAYGPAQGAADAEAFFGIISEG